MNTPLIESGTGPTTDTKAPGGIEVAVPWNKPAFLVVVLFLILATPTRAQLFKNGDGLAHTFSIVARDEKTGDMAVGVQSHWFGVGTSVPWAEAGVGAIATQSLTQKSFGVGIE